ncbi:MAG: class I SAM-dependent methyltransferase [Rhodanobacteraceae bacterium]|nr:class I SAM-dependent methyltransferase [Rhodanobacteraceae bacterium]
MSDHLVNADDRVKPAKDGANHPTLIRVHDALICCDSAWEEAYLRFESPEQEISKFRQRLLRLGAEQWSRDATIVELFCGRGGALCAWKQLGFSRLEGVDLSERLLRQYQGAARLYVCDARDLPFDSASRDIIAVQGGLHHLERLPQDVDRTLAEAARVLRPGGLFVAVEPWLTPFLRAVHAISEIKLVRRTLPKFDAFATMTEHERSTYEAWLHNPELVLQLLRKHFEPQHLRIRLGKLEFVGRRRD